MIRPLPKPDVILVHESDLDGFLSGLLLQRLATALFGGQIRLEAYHYQAWKQRDLRERAAWVADFSFEPRMDRPDWVIIDHHPTDLVPQHAHLIHDVNKSAGGLCYELCREHGISSPVLDRLMHWNNVSDLFLENDPEFATASDYANLVKVYNFWNLHAVIEGEPERLVDHPLLEVMAVKRRVEDPIGFEWSKKNIVELSPTVGFVDTVVGNTNLIVHQLLESGGTRFPVLVTLFKKANNQIIVSLRSKNGEALPVADKLLGVVPTRRLLVNPLDKLIRELMVLNAIAIPHTATLLDVCEMFVLHKFLAFPVVDEERHLCGVIDISFFAAEVFEMSEEESHDEIFDTIGLHVEQLRNASAGTAFRHRFPWLLGTIGSGMICAVLAGAFEKTLAHAVAIAFFLPLVLGLNESTAMQSMSLSLQALHGSKNTRWLIGRLRRELATAFLLALAAAGIAGLLTAVWKSIDAGLVIGATILGSLVVAAVVGFGIPILLRRGNRDPKIAAGPVTLAVVDILALLLYFSMAKFAL